MSVIIDLKQTLLYQAKEIAEYGHHGWGNTMQLAHDEIERLERELATAKADQRKKDAKIAESEFFRYVKEGGETEFAEGFRYACTRIKSLIERGE